VSLGGCEALGGIGPEPAPAGPAGPGRTRMRAAATESSVSSIFQRAAASFSLIRSVSREEKRVSRPANKRTDTSRDLYIVGPKPLVGRSAPVGRLEIAAPG